jgi:[ribosomal protein S18]-alanine N-acetyltransferase
VPTIREAAIEELEKVAEIDRNAFPEMSYPLFALRQFFDICKGYFLVATDENDELVGYTLGNLDLNDRKGWVLSLGVLKNQRSGGIGFQLTSSLIEKLEKNGAQEIFLTVAPNNEGAVRLYKKLEFEEIGIDSNYYCDGEERVLMKKTFSKTN